MALILQNFSSALTTTATGVGDTSITVGSVAKLPTLAAGDYFYAVITSAVDLTKREIVKVTAISGTILTVVRAQESTTALAFPVGSLIEQRLTKNTIKELIPNSTGSLRGYRDIAVSTTLTADDLGKYIYISANNVTITLPAANTLEAGSKFIIQAGAIATNGVLVTSSSGISGTHAGNTTVITDGGTLEFVSNGTDQYKCYNGGGWSSKLSNGWSYNANGVLTQWGIFSSSPTADTTVTFPIAFPNNCLNLVVTAASSGSGVTGSFNTLTNTGFKGNAWASNTVRQQGGSCNYLAIGY